MSARRVVLAAGLAALMTGACQAPTREAVATPPVSEVLLSRFRLEQPDHTADESGLPLVSAARAVDDGPALLGVPGASEGAVGSATPGASEGAADAAGSAASGAEAVSAGDDVARGAASDVLHLEDVLLSVEAQFPLVLAAMEQFEIAGGELLASEGAFDTKLEAGTVQELDGYYDGDEYDFKVEQPTTLWGLAVSGGYRRGEGSFAVYDGKRKTNTGGEFKLGARLPLLQGGRIDEARVAMWQAAIERDRAAPAILGKRLEATRKAASAYWKWVAAGGKRAIAQRLLQIAETRQGQVQASVDAGELAEIDLVDNRRQIVDRQAKLAAVERNLQQAAILLSLYWRDAEGRPVVPPDDALPETFPTPRDPAQTLVPDDEDVALQRRPELRELELQLEGLELEGQLYRNQLLPDLDLALEASQDVGDAVNTPDDKGDLEYEASLRFRLPLQRRKPEGKRLANEAKRAKLGQELRYLRDVVVSEVRDATSALRQSWLRTGQALENVDLALQLEQAERVQLQLGESDLFRVNVREKQSAQAAAGLVDALSEYFVTLAVYRAVLGIPYDEVLAGERVGGDEADEGA